MLLAFPAPQLIPPPLPHPSIPVGPACGLPPKGLRPGPARAAARRRRRRRRQRQQPPPAPHGAGALAEAARRVCQAPGALVSAAGCCGVRGRQRLRVCQPRLAPRLLHHVPSSLPLPSPPCSFSAQDTTHSFAKGGQGLRPVLGLLSRTLQELCIAHCSDIFHAKSFAQLAQLQVCGRLLQPSAAGVSVAWQRLAAAAHDASEPAAACRPPPHTIPACSLPPTLRRAWSLWR